ncbi:hypothetical protein I4U23_004961 [Adineta vaga]|nr:hypothetical protein I4U23_004961 [Adineta vaga]
MFHYFSKEAPDVDPKQHVCSRTENGMIRVSQRFNGFSRLGEVLHLQGPYISLEQLNGAVARLQRRHPVLRSRLQAHPTIRDWFVLEEDEMLRLPVEELARKREERDSFWLQEWPKREKEPINIGEPLAKLWLLQDPDDKEDVNGFREVVIMCEHAICDAQCLSNAAHELLQILSDETGHACEQPLPWSATIEDAIRNSLSAVNRAFVVSRFIFSAIYTHMKNRLPIARVPFDEVNFDINEIDKYCHSEIVYGVLNKEMTAKLLARCRRERVTVTSAVISAVLSATARVVPVKDGQDTIMNIGLSADARRRYVPPIPSHDMGYHASNIEPFGLRVSAAPKTPEDLWQLAQTYAQHMNACVNAGQIFAVGLIAGKIVGKLMGPINMAYIPTSSMSSWGVLPFVEQYGPWQLTAMTPFLNVRRWAAPFIVIQTVNGVLTMMFSGASPIIPASVLIALRDRCMDALQQMIVN